MIFTQYDFNDEYRAAGFGGGKNYICNAYYDALPTDANIVTQVTINAEDPADVSVYAVWALDRNGNYIAEFDTMPRNN